MNRIDVRIPLVLVICGISGGSMFILVKALVGQVSPLQLVAARIVLASLVLGSAVLLLNLRPQVTRDLLAGAGVLAVFDAIAPYLLIASAAPYVLASTSALLVATMPMFTGLFVTFTDRTRLPGHAIAGLMLGILGVGVLAGPRSLEVSDSSTLAMLAVLLSAASYAVAAVFARRALRTTDPITLSVFKFAIAGAVVIPMAVLKDGTGEFSALSTEAWLGLLGIGCLSTGLAKCGYVWVIGRAGSVAASLLTYIVPVAALVLGWVFLNETPTTTRLLAAGIVAAAVTCTLFGDRLLALTQKHLPAAPELEVHAERA